LHRDLGRFKVRAEKISRLKFIMAAKTTTKRPDFRDAFGVNVLNSRHKDIRRIRRNHPPAIHGNKCWTSSYLIMDYLRKNGLPKSKKKKCRVMEVGCGWGLASIFCAKEYGAKITGTDADNNVFPYLDLHAEINGVEMRRYTAKFEDLTLSELSEFDLVLGADICFWEQLIEPLWKLVQNSMDAGVKQIIIGDLGREPFEEVARRSLKKFSGKKKQKLITKPVRSHGYLLVVDR
jgi:predicted nicotinamide N-methyase